ncbi:STAS domain-containing protein [Nonomuraea fuscirosea]|uniref:STAS domain-containing protein n=1 Tax=Nonomuraea fuscirosea TaxID=1291556 RepID=UPI00343AEEF3
MMQLSVRLVPIDDATLVIALTGELDTTTRPVLAAFLDPLPRSPVMHVLVAAGDLWFCDLNGLEQLAATHDALLAKGGHLAVAEPRPPLRRLISLMSEQDQTFFPVFASMAEALASAGVAEYRTEAPPGGAYRHLPYMRPLPRLQSGGRRLRTRREPSLAFQAGGATTREAPAASPVAPVPSGGSLAPLVERSRMLRRQAFDQKQTLARRRATAVEARSLLHTTLERCDDNLTAIRSNLVQARAVASLGHLRVGSLKLPTSFRLNGG